MAILAFAWYFMTYICSILDYVGLYIPETYDSSEYTSKVTNKLFLI